MAYIEFDDGLVIQTDTPELHTSGRRISAREGKRKRREYALARVREIVKPGDTLYTVLRHVSRSGMQRRIDVVAMVNGEPRNLSAYAADILKWRLHNHGGIVVDGCGMDMGFQTVYSLSRCLFPDGFDCIGKGCPSNDHSNREDNAHHRDGGYAIRHQWL